MNLLVSYNWLREFLPGLKATPEEVAEKLSLHAFSVERLRRMDEGLDEKVVVGKILEIKSHPNADKLRLVKCQLSNVKCQIVCGGTNIREGMLVAVALPGAKVRWHGEGEPVELKPTEIRGVKSEGMICAANEIGLEALTSVPHPSPLPEGEGSRRRGEGDKREILDLTATGARVGDSVAKSLGLDDTVLEVEITSNRPDAMGIVGLAREISAIFGTKLVIRNLKLGGGHNAPRPPLTLRGGGALLNVKVEVPKLCPRYIAVEVDGVKVAPSPWWMQRRLIASGVRPINNIVDITNYVLLEWGQPCHAFDALKLETRNSKLEIVVRTAKKGEKILALDGNTYELDENILVIADARRPIAIAGIMGGEETGVTEKTTRIVYEIANFDPVAVRRGEHQLGLTSESSARFNKGLPVQLPGMAAARLIELTKEVVGGEVAQVVDRHNPPRPSLILREGDRSKPPLKIRGGLPAQAGRGSYESKVQVSPQEVVKKIGVEIPAVQMKKYLTALGFMVSGSTKKWSVKFPYWRSLEADGVADIAEEVARMYGYHRLPSVLPQGDLPGEAPNAQFIQEHAIKEALRGAGFTELYTYSFVSREDIVRGGFDAARDALALANPLSAELTHMRPWLGISVLKAVGRNQKERERLRLFELSAEYHPRHNSPQPSLNLREGDRKQISPLRLRGGAGELPQLPDERQKLIVVSAGREASDGENFYAVKGAAEHLAEILALPNFGYEKVGSTAAPWVKHYHPARVLLCKSGRDILGVVGELHPQLLKAYGIEHRVAFLEWEIRALLPLIGRGRAYVLPPPYPPVKRDIAFLVSKETEYVTLYRAITAIDPLVLEVELFDQYEGKGVSKGEQSIAFHISYGSPDRTLTAEEADKAHGKMEKMLEQKFGAKIRK